MSKLFHKSHMPATLAGLKTSATGVTRPDGAGSSLLPAYAQRKFCRKFFEAARLRRRPRKRYAVAGTACFDQSRFTPVARRNGEATKIDE